MRGCSLPPFDLVALDFGVGALVVEDAPPGADPAAKAGGELGEFALLALVVADLFDRLVRASARRSPDRARGFCRRCGRSRGAIASLRSSPATHASARLSIMRKSPENSRCPSAAQHAARDVGEHGQRAAELRDVGAVACGARRRAPTAAMPSSLRFRLCSMRPGRGPAAGRGAVHASACRAGGRRRRRNRGSWRTSARSSGRRRVAVRAVARTCSSGSCASTAATERLPSVAMSWPRALIAARRLLHLIDAGDRAVGQFGLMRTLIALRSLAARVRARRSTKARSMRTPRRLISASRSCRRRSRFARDGGAWDGSTPRAW